MPPSHYPKHLARRPRQAIIGRDDSLTFLPFSSSTRSFSTISFIENMTAISILNSSIQPWLDYDGGLITDVSPCSQWTDVPNATSPRIITTDNCAAVCNETGLLSDSAMSDNLLTCGMFAALATTRQYTANATASLANFRHLGLDPDNMTSTNIVMDTIGYTLSTLYIQLSSWGISYDESSIPEACSGHNIFIRPNNLYQEIHHATLSTGELQSCVDSICSPRRLDPDLGGVGVLYSFCFLLASPLLTDERFLCRSSCSYALPSWPPSCCRHLIISLSVPDH